MTDTNIVPEEIVESKIMLMRGKKVLLDRDIAFLYEVKTRALRQQVSRNKDRFPEDFMFVLTEDELKIMVSQNVTPSKKHFGGSLPYVFTEQGIAMLSSVLTSPRAVQVNIQIMRTFAKLREIMASHGELRERIEAMEKKYDRNFNVVFEAIKKLIDEPAKTKVKIGFK